MPTNDDVSRFKELLKYRWLCSTCEDGMPHKGYPYKHSRGRQRVGEAYITFFCTGRGWGKTKSAAEFVVHRMMSEPKHRVTVVVPHFAIGRDVVIEGESGVLACLPDGYVTNYNRSLGEVNLRNGSMLKLFGAHSKDDANAIRGSQSATVWMEEISYMNHAQDAWENALLANRLGENPKVVVTATPRNTTMIRKLFNDPEVDRRTGSTLDNSENLAQRTVDYLVKKYQGTRLGLQELEGLLLEETVGALWSRDMFHFVEKIDLDDLDRIVVAIDPPGSHRAKGSAEAGIIVAGKRGDLVYVLEDLSQIASPEQWSQVAVDAYDKYSADCIIAEANFGGSMVQSTLRAVSTRPKFKMVTASRGKMLRAEPVVNLYERGSVLHVGSEESQEELVKQCVGWVPPGRFETDEDGIQSPIEPSSYSPDRLDALVHACTELMLLPRRRVAIMTCSVPSRVRSF